MMMPTFDPPRCINEYLATLADKLDLPESSLNSDGLAGLSCLVEGVSLELLIMWLDTQATLAIATPVARAPAEGDRADFFAALLAANLFGRGNQGLCFSFSPGEDRIFLEGHIYFPGATYDSFESVVARVISLGALWKKQFSQNKETGL